ncbi:hypothetical protein D3C85_1312850 [compost metagenome]
MCWLCVIRQRSQHSHCLTFRNQGDNARKLTTCKFGLYHQIIPAFKWDDILVLDVLCITIEQGNGTLQHLHEVTYIDL